MTHTFEHHRTLRPADIGADVAELQRLLSTALALDPPLVVDGHFGPVTRQAVIALQASSVGPDGAPLLVDGVVGPVTWWALTTVDQSIAHTGAARGFRAGEPRCELGRAVLEVLAEEIERGAREVGSDNAGPHVRRYTSGIEGSAWCAWQTTWTIHEAARRIGIEPPVTHQGGARRVLRELEARGLGVETPQAADVVCWWRGAPDSWMGHVGIVTDYSDGVLWTVEANRGAYPAPLRQFSYVLEREKRLLGFARLG